MLHFLFIKYTGIACHRDACYVSSHSEACLMKLRQVISTNNSTHLSMTCRHIAWAHPWRNNCHLNEALPKGADT